jgi:nitroreductase
MGAVPLPHRAVLSGAESLRAAEAFRDRLARRHSVRAFDPARPVAEAVIAACVRAAGSAPSGANRQPWHFVAIADPALKARIREGAEEEERAFYATAPQEWLDVLAPLGTDAVKTHLTDAPWLIVAFAERWAEEEGRRVKNYYVPESVGISLGFLIAALHEAGLCCLPHTPAPMRFLNALCGRPEREKPVMILPVGHPAPQATIPAEALRRKPLPAILSVIR